MAGDRQEVLKALGSVPELAGLAEPREIARLGGLTNRVFRVDFDERSVIVRIPGEGTEAYIDRAVEAYNARAAARAGVSPEVVFADAKSGLMITETVPNIVTMTPEEFARRAGAPARAGRAFAKLHGSGETFRFRFELFSMIEEYLGVLSGKDVRLPDGYHDVVAAADPVKEALSSADLPLAPCHCDPLCENFLDDSEVMWIVDWEYSGMNDPMWDLGDLSVEAGMTEAQDAEMLEAYFGRTPKPAEVGRMVIYKAMCDLLWTLWGLIQLADGNPAEDFWAYATERFERCKALMDDPAFAHHVAAVRQG